MIIFNHKGLSWYQDPVFECVRKYNPNEDIVLIGDNTNKYLADKYHFIFAHRDCLDYSDRYRGFLSNVQIIGTVKGEIGIRTTLESRLRWFRIYTFMKSNGVKDAWYFDSDVLVYQNLKMIEEKYNALPYWIIDTISGSSTRINDIDYLNELCDTIYLLHLDPKFTYNQRLQVLQRINDGKQYNFCDMTCIDQFRKNNSGSIGDLSNILNGCTFDPNINNLEINMKPSPYRFSQVISDRGQPRKKIMMSKDDMGKYPYGFDEISQQNIRLYTLNMSWLPPQEFSRIYNSDT